MNEADIMDRIAARLFDWDPWEALQQKRAEEYQRDAIAEAQSEEQAARMRAAIKRTETRQDQNP